MFAGLMLIVAFSNLLFDFLGDDVNCSIKIAFDIFREQVGAAEIEADGTGKLLFGGAGVVVFEGDAGINSELIEVLEFINPTEDVVFDSFSQGYVMRRKDQVHSVMMVANTKKIQ